MSCDSTMPLNVCLGWKMGLRTRQCVSVGFGKRLWLTEVLCHLVEVKRKQYSVPKTTTVSLSVWALSLTVYVVWERTVGSHSPKINIMHIWDMTQTTTSCMKATHSSSTSSTPTYMSLLTAWLLLCEERCHDSTVFTIYLLLRQIWSGGEPNTEMHTTHKGCQKRSKRYFGICSKHIYLFKFITLISVLVNQWHPCLLVSLMSAD